MTGSDPVSLEVGEVKGASEGGEKKEVEEKKDKSYLVSGGLVVLGLILISGTGVVFYKQGLYNYKSDEK